MNKVDISLPMNWKEYESLPIKQQTAYWCVLKMQYHAYDRMIAEMMGISRKKLESHNRLNGVPAIRSSKPDLSVWKRFLSSRPGFLQEPTQDESGCQAVRMPANNPEKEMAEQLVLPDMPLPLEAPVISRNGKAEFHCTEGQYYQLVDLLNYYRELCKIQQNELNSRRMQMQTKKLAGADLPYHLAAVLSAMGYRIEKK